MISLKILLVLVVSLATSSLTASDLRVLFFTMNGCPPCEQTEPNIDRLEQSGIAVSKIDVRQYSEYSTSCGVTQTPTIILTDGQQVLARHTGAMTLADLQRMVAAHQVAQSPVSTQATTPNHPTAQTSLASHNPSTPSSMPAGDQGMTPEQLANQATVRLRVEDQLGTSFATGTVIHRVDNEALVLTCGHVFRDSDGTGKINVDLGFTGNQPVTVVGNLISFDADNHDIALVAIPCPLAIQPVSVAPESLAMQTGDQVFSLGCDRGQPPSVRQSALKAVTRYSGVSKYDTVGRPVDGRSGGGLFTLGGQLVGVCNAAAVEVDEGIYTGLETVWWQFAKSNLTHLFRKSNSPTSPAGANPVMQAGASANASIPNAVGGPRQSSTQVPINAAVFKGNTPPARNAANTTTTAVTGQLELIVVVRSADDPSQSETITIANPDPQMLEMIARARQNANDGGSDPRLARLPDLQPVTRQNQSQMRAQSPR